MIDRDKPHLFYSRGAWHCIGAGHWFRREGVNEALIAWKKEQYGAAVLKAEEQLTKGVTNGLSGE